MKKTLLIALSFAAAASTAAIAAPAPDQVHVVKVGYGDLNLKSTADAQRLLHRLDRAAADACGASGFSLPEVKAAVRRSTCYRGSMDRAVATLNAPTVNSLYAQRAQVYALN
ncbi:MAG: UrcA family protein [Phenylobacterium sp.]|nr:UrcA family protein [Phenylobacterium sp.]